jgi:hypothetical protein
MSPRDVAGAAHLYYGNIELRIHDNDGWEWFVDHNAANS